jgi:hypothetical protein
MEEEYYDVVDTYIATVKKAKTGKCEICQDTYEKEISEEDKYDLGFHPDVDVDKFHSGIRIK